MSSMFQYFSYKLEKVGRQGTAANIRTGNFAAKVQELIDGSKWRSKDISLRSRIGKDLIVDGRVISDIDALGVFDGTLLIVECKSVFYDSNDDEGVYKGIFNVQRDIEKAARKLVSDYSAALRSDSNTVPDLRPFKKVLSLICTPQVVYVTHETALEEVAPGLRRVATFTELARFLSQ